MDPSCTIGFYAEGQKDFESLCTVVSEVADDCEQNCNKTSAELDFSQLTSCSLSPQAVSTSVGTYPMFVFAEGQRQEDDDDDEGGKDAPTNITYIQRRSERRRVDTCNSMDEFVVL